MARAYIKVPIAILDDYRMASKPASEWRKIITGWAHDPARIHYEADHDYRYEYNLMRGQLSKELAARDAKVCRYCGSTENLSIDHIVPLARGGTNDLDNLQFLCMPCNRRKGAK